MIVSATARPMIVCATSSSSLIFGLAGGDLYNQSVIELYRNCVKTRLIEIDAGGSALG